MTAAKHTPGPWITTAAGGWDAVCEAANVNSLICRLVLNEPANAALISAAPELLEALDEIINLCAIGDVDETTKAYGWGEAIKSAKAAIAKATGAVA